MTGFEIIVMGASLGGLHALEVVLGALPRGFSVPVAIAQHRCTDFGETLSGLLAGHCQLPVTEPDDKEAIQSGHVYVAPSDYHLLIDDGRFALSTDPPVQHARPSIDVLFASAADAHANRTIGVILTGTNPDGAQGLAAIKQCGGLAVVQDPSTAEGQAMPAAAIDAGRIDHILPLRDIATLLVEFCLEKEG